jgi:hypothetical protein
MGVRVRGLGLGLGSHLVESARIQAWVDLGSVHLVHTCEFTDGDMYVSVSPQLKTGCYAQVR